MSYALKTQGQVEFIIKYERVFYLDFILDKLSSSIHGKIEKFEEGWTCKQCGFFFKHKSSCLLHVEAIHDAAGHVCPYQSCMKFCPSKNALRTHISRYHRSEKYSL